MKKVLAGVLAAIVAVSLTGCATSKRDNSYAETALSSSKTTSSKTSSSKTTSSGTTSLDKESSASSQDAPTGGTFSSELPQELKRQYKDAAEKLKQELESTYSTVGDTYDSYVKNKQAIKDWYKLVKSETDNLYYDTLTKSIDYYKALAASEDREEYGAYNKAFDELYDAVDGECMDYIYDEVYSKLFDDLYDKYYKGVLDDSDVTDDYSAWLDEYSGFYSDWLDAYSGFYSDWLDAHSDFYSDWLNVKSGFFSKNYDIDSLIENAPSAPDDNQSKTSGESSENTTESSSSKENTSEESLSSSIPSDVIRPEIKEAIDSYEAFIDEYCDFLKKMSNTSDTATMLKEYNEYLGKLSEMSDKFDKIENEDLTTAESAYYTEVMLRCNKKMLEASNDM